MSKAVLVMDMPKYCIDCPCHFADDTGAVICGKEDKVLLSDDIQTYKPGWCPLRELPKRISGSQKYKNDYEKGWNACLDTIIGGKQWID